MRDPEGREVLKDEECFEIIRKKLSQESMDHFSLISYEIVPVLEVNGFMGQYFILKATAACPQSPEETFNVNFFTKIPPLPNTPMYDFNKESGNFQKEVVLYTTVFPEVLDEMDRKYIPRCFFALENDVIVLEDMSHSGFVMTDKSVPFDFHHCEVVVKTLAKFHAKSLIFEYQYENSLAKRFTNWMHETLWPVWDGKGKKMFASAVKGLLSMVDLLDDLNFDEKQKLKKRITMLVPDHPSKLCPSTKHKNVLCHGDLWANNVLYKYDNDGKPIACCLIDFQLARYNPPAHDLLCFLQFTTTRKFRAMYLDTLFKIYHKSLTISLEDAGLDVSTILSWDDFMESIIDLRLTCLMHGILNIPVMLLDQNAVQKYFADEPALSSEFMFVDRSNLIRNQYREIQSYRNRLQDSLVELYDHLVK